MGPVIGSLCSGYGGLTLAVQSVLGGRVAWHSEYDDAPSKVLDARFPGVSNLGDMTAIDWSAVEPVDLLEGGTPCQDVSHAGPRTGMRAGTRSGLWSAMADAIDVLRPRLVVWENVRGVLSARADSGLEPCPVCVGDGSGPALRALGRVLGDLADLGYDARWCGLPASAVGAPHGRFRVFVVAHPSGVRRGAGGRSGPGEAAGGGALSDVAGSGERSAADSENNRRSPLVASGHEPERTRAAGDHEAPAEPARVGRGEGRPEPAGQLGRPHALVCGAATVADADRLGPAQLGDETAEHDADGCGSTHTAWGAYEPAIRRWERIIGRPAPAPRMMGKRGGDQLAPAFSEWMMGLPDGWVTGVPGLTRNEQLKALGNGVVPQQAAAALRHLLDLS